MGLVRSVFDAARNRVRFIFREFERIVVSYSGGKDSTCTFYLALWEAERANRTFEVFFLDQEAEYRSTIDMVEMVMGHPRAIPRWYQVPMLMTNATSHRDIFLRAWEPGADWVHPKHPLATHRIEGAYPDRFHDFFEWFEGLDTVPTAHLVGLRAFESMNRQRSILKQNGYGNYAWSTKCKGATESYRFYPIWDFQGGDVWKMIADHDLPYNRVYDRMIARSGANIRTMRVSNLIHEQAFRSLASLQEFEPDTYDRLVARLGGVHCAARYAEDEYLFDATRLPAAFRTWREYRDHLIATTPIGTRERFLGRFGRQGEDEAIHQHQVKQILLNDWEGKLPRTKRTGKDLRAVWWKRL